MLFSKTQLILTLRALLTCAYQYFKIYPIVLVFFAIYYQFGVLVLVNCDGNTYTFLIYYHKKDINNSTVHSMTTYKNILVYSITNC